MTSPADPDLDPALEAIRVVRDVAPWMTDDELDKGPMRELRLVFAALAESTGAAGEWSG